MNITISFNLQSGESSLRMLSDDEQSSDISEDNEIQDQV